MQQNGRMESIDLWLRLLSNIQVGGCSIDIFMMRIQFNCSFKLEEIFFFGSPEGYSPSYLLPVHSLTGGSRRHAKLQIDTYMGKRI